MADRRLPDERLRALLDLAGELIARVFGPEDELAEIRIDARTCTMRIVSEQGGRLTVDQEPSAN